MSRLTFEGVSKSFGGTQVLEPFDAEISDGEFLVLLGPSGCGKSTLLRMIAGLTDITSGSLLFNDVPVNEMDVRKRDIAFVFQSYALYPQMTVRQNIAFPLLMDRMSGWQHLPVLSTLIRSRLMKEPQVRDQVQGLAEQLGLTDYLDRRPGALSGGQRQRVALARSLVRQPSLYLLDEPLSNLDAKLRTQMRTDIAALHRSVGKTFIYVTHDQIEAMTMATRIIVLDGGRIQQIGTPDEIYDRPANMTVAKFVGSPPMNLIASSAAGGHWWERVRTPHTGEVVLGIRPENLDITASDRGIVPATVETVERTGPESIVALNIEGNSEARTYARVSNSATPAPGSSVGLSFDVADCSFFDLSTGERAATPLHA
ncbi:ABC transporter ATP-binding protein [Nesterenkonia populi]